MTFMASRWPARMDVIQGGTGFILVMFLWAHMFFVSSILISKDAMYFVARLFEGEPLLGRPYPILVSFVAGGVFLLIVVHAFLALRKFPGNTGQYQLMHRHLRRFPHADTRLWYVQVISGFVLFFLVSVHLYQLMLNPADIGPYASSDRVWTGKMWPLYLVLLFAAEIHGGIGIYRLAVKWGLFLGRNPKKARHRLSMVKWSITVFFIVLGTVTLAAYMKIGAEHADRAGERYVPTSELQEKDRANYSH